MCGFLPSLPFASPCPSAAHVMPGPWAGGHSSTGEPPQIECRRSVGCIRGTCPVSWWSRISRRHDKLDGPRSRRAKPSPRPTGRPTRGRASIIPCRHWRVLICMGLASVDLAPRNLQLAAARMHAGCQGKQDARVRDGRPRSQAASGWLLKGVTPVPASLVQARVFPSPPAGRLIRDLHPFTTMTGSKMDSKGRWFGMRGAWLTFWVTVACATDMTLFG